MEKKKLYAAIVGYGNRGQVYGDYSLQCSDEFGVGSRKDDAETMKLVNEGYKLLKADPYWKELQAKYLGNK